MYMSEHQNLDLELINDNASQKQGTKYKNSGRLKILQLDLYTTPFENPKSPIDGEAPTVVCPSVTRTCSPNKHEIVVPPEVMPQANGSHTATEDQVEIEDSTPEYGNTVRDNDDHSVEDDVLPNKQHSSDKIDVPSEEIIEEETEAGPNSPIICAEDVVQETDSLDEASAFKTFDINDVAISYNKEIHDLTPEGISSQDNKKYIPGQAHESESSSTLPLGNSNSITTNHEENQNTIPESNSSRDIGDSIQHNAATEPIEAKEHVIESGECF